MPHNQNAIEELQGLVVADAAYAIYLKQPRFKDQGRCEETGLDCSGLLICVARRVGSPYTDNTRHSKRPNVEEMLGALREQMVPIPLTETRAGDVVVLREPKWPCHYAILDRQRPGDTPGVKYVIHAHARSKKVIREQMPADQGRGRTRRTRRQAVVAFRAKEW